MSLATRCSGCGTVFRVVQDQLKVSGGWVRCGRCAGVFNAIENLVDLENDRGGDASAPVPPAPPAPPAPSDTGHAVPDSRPSLPGADTDNAPMAAAPLAPPDATAEPDPDHGDPAQGQAEPATEGARPADGAPNYEGARLPAAATEALRAATWTQPPRFIRQAERAARWRHPAVRAGLALVALVLALVLAAQALLAWHDLAAQRHPALRPWIDRLCQWQGCRVEPPRRLDALTVDSSGLTRAGPAGVYRLALVVRNRDPELRVRAPSFELSLTDAGGQVVARRVLAAGQLGAAAEALPPGAEWPLAATLRTGSLAVAGYTLELFYP